MKRLLLVGKTGCGKTSLSQALQGLDLTYRKTQAVSYSSHIVDTPGEFLENRRYYSALLASSTTCDIIGLVQDATIGNSVFPPNFATMFNKQILGIVSKVEHPHGNITRAEKFLRWAGADTVIHTSAITLVGIEQIRLHLVGRPSPHLRIA